MLTPTHPKMVDFTTNLISAAKDVKHIVKFSHIMADAQPGITITRLHRQAEKVIEESGIPYTKIRYMDISEDQLREGIKQMGINEWHANVIIELLRITRDGYVSGISSAVKKVTGKEPISFSTFAKEFGNVLT